MTALLEGLKRAAENHRRTASSISQWRSLHDERNAKGSGNYYRIPGGAGDLVVLGKSSPAASVKIRRRSRRDCHCIASHVSIFAHEF
jgi:hypothetical protein